VILTGDLAKEILLLSGPQMDANEFCRRMLTQAMRRDDGEISDKVEDLVGNVPSTLAHHVNAIKHQTGATRVALWF